jgi:hypothetical protein
LYSSSEYWPRTILNIQCFVHRGSIMCASRRSAQRWLKKNNELQFFFKEEFEDTKGVIRIHISKKNKQHNGQKKKDQQRSTKHTHKTKDRVTLTPLKTGGELRCSGSVGSSWSTSDTRRVNLMNEEMTGKCLWQVEHIRGHLWHRYSITLNHVMVATVTLSK